MTPARIRSIRRRLGLSQADFGRKVLKYKGPSKNVSISVLRLEKGRRNITPGIEALVRAAAERGGV